MIDRRRKGRRMKRLAYRAVDAAAAIAFMAYAMARRLWLVITCALRGHETLEHVHHRTWGCPRCKRTWEIGR